MFQIEYEITCDVANLLGFLGNLQQNPTYFARYLILHHLQDSNSCINLRNGQNSSLYPTHQLCKDCNKSV